MSGNYKSNFNRYKRNLRWKATMRKKGSFVREADYNGWPNWDSWHTALLMDNDEPLYRRVRELMERGINPEELKNWATQHVIAPHNQQQIAEAQEWNAIPREERERMKRQRDIDQFGEDAVNIGGGLFNAMGHDPYAEEEIESPDMMMDPELVDWPSVHRHILSEYPDDHPIHQLQQPQPELQVPQQQPNPDAPGDFTLPQGFSRRKRSDNYDYSYPVNGTPWCSYCHGGGRDYQAPRGPDGEPPLCPQCGGSGIEPQPDLSFIPETQHPGGLE